MIVGRLGYACLQKVRDQNLQLRPFLLCGLIMLLAGCGAAEPVRVNAPLRAAFEVAKQDLADQNYSAAITSATYAISLVTPQDSSVGSQLHRIRANAYSELGQYEEALADVSVLVERYGNASDYLSRAALYSSMGDDFHAVLDCSHLLEKSDPKSQVSKEFADAYFGGGDFTVKLPESAERANEEMRTQSIAMVARVLEENPGSPSAIEVLRDVGDDAKPYASLIRQQVVDGKFQNHPTATRYAFVALAQTNDASVMPILLSHLNSEMSWVRAAAATALGVVGDPVAVAPLVKMLHEDSEYHDSWTVKRAILGIGSDAVPVLREMESHPSYGSVVQPLLECLIKHPDYAEFLCSDLF